MVILQVEHQTKDFDAWKKMFDSDPAGRERSGAKRFRVMRLANNRNSVLVELEFDRPEDAQKLISNLKPVWDRAVAQQAVQNPQWRILEVVETKELAAV